MSNRPIMVLLVGEIPRSSLELLLRFYEQGCRCHFAMSYRDACSLIEGDSPPSFYVQDITQSTDVMSKTITRRGPVIA